jgi:opacity protein-like surface antigen
VNASWWRDRFWRRRLRPPGPAWTLGVAVVLVLASIVLTPLPAAAVRDWNRTDDPMEGALGLHVGKIGGVGLAYKYPLKWWLYVQTAGGIWHTNANKRHNIGFQVHYLLRQDDRLRLYLTMGAGYFYHKKVEDKQPDEVSENWNTGFGVGVELLRGDRMSVQIEGDFTHEGEDNDILFLPQVAAFYYF